MAESLLKLKWNSHLNSLLKVLESLRTKARYTDVTLACEGRLFTVHRLVLASCSQFFDHIFEQTPAENTVIVLNEAKAQDIESLLDYMYCGEVDVLQSNLSSFLRTAECLQIKGLAVPDDDAFEIDNPQVAPIDSPHKKKKGDSRPSSAGSSCHGPERLNQSRELQPRGIVCSGASNIPSPTLPNIIPSRWVFQKSDLPNTTWSSQGHSDSVIIENEAPLDSGRRQKEDGRTWGPEVPEATISHSRLANLMSEPAAYYRSQRNAVEEHDQTEALPLKINEAHRSDAASEALEIKTEMKEEKPFLIDESDNSSKDFQYPQELDLNNSHRERNEGETQSNLISNYRQSTTIKTYSAPDDHTTKLISITTPSERHSTPLAGVKSAPSSNVQLWENMASSSAEIGGNANQQATLSPKLMPYAKCSNCYTNNTKLWRRSMNGEIVCNACGLYFKLHGVNRPSHLFRNAPMTRRRNPKKKRKCDELSDMREQYNSSEEVQDSFYNETTCDTDTQEGLAVLNAALTLNSLFAKAKAQEAAAKCTNSHQNSTSVSSSNRVPSSTHEPSTSSSLYGCESSSTSTTDSRPPPPPLLKLPLHGSGATRPISYFPQQLTSAPGSESWNNLKVVEEDCGGGKSVPSVGGKGPPMAGESSQETKINSKSLELSQYQKSVPSSPELRESRMAIVQEVE